MGFKRTDKCLAKVADDEPIFVLRAQDLLAPDKVRKWACEARAKGCPADKVQEAYECATQMDAWAAKNGGKYPD